MTSWERGPVHEKDSGESAFDGPCFYPADLYFSHDSLFVRVSEPAADSYLFLWIHPWKPGGNLFYSGPFGFYMLIFIYIGYVNGICTKYYYEDYITLPLVLCVLNELAYNMYMYVFRFLIRGRLNLFYYFRNIMLPEIIFSVVTTLFIYRLFLFTSRRLEEMEKRRDTTIV